MDLISQSKSFIDSERQVKFQKQVWEYKIDMKVFILSDRFIEYQKDMFNEFAASLWDSETSDIKRQLQKSLQKLNTNLWVFAQKIKDSWKFSIKWYIQVISGSQYLCGIIGETSIIIFRNWKINMVVSNEIDPKSKIDIFWEFIEWDLEPGDKVLLVWMNILDYITKNELTDLINLAKDWSNSLELVLQWLEIRTSSDQIGFAHYEDINSNVNWKIIETKSYWSNKVKNIVQNIWNFVIKNKYTTWWVILILFVIIFLYSIINNINAKNQIGFIENWDQKLQFNLDINELRKDVTLLAAISNPEEKNAKYQEIMKKIEVFEKKWKQKYDIAQIKQELNSSYYKMFNISLINDFVQAGGKNILSFSQEEKNILGSGQLVFFSNWVNIIWNKWAILWASSENIRWKTTTYWNILQSQKIVWALPNIQWNWYYIYTSWSIYNLNAQNFSSVSPKNTTFPSDILSIWKYASNIYIVSKQNLLDWKMIQKYQSVQWWFWQPQIYTYSGGINNISSFVVDNSTFLVWWNDSLHQLTRKDWTNTLLERSVELKGENNILPLSKDIKILANDSSDYMFLYDTTNQNLGIYKANKKRNQFDYYLNYLWKIKFDTNDKILDIAISYEWEKSSAYILTANWVLQLPLSSYMIEN